MYYYILDGKHQPTFRLSDRLKKELTKSNIAGEITRTDELQGVERLVSLGRQKGYSTIVAVGSDQHIHSVAHQLLNTDAAFGLIPIDNNSLYLSLLGISSWPDALTILRNRRVEQISVGETDEGEIFLDRITIDNPTGHQLRIVEPKLVIESEASRIEIQNGGIHGPRLNQLIVKLEGTGQKQSALSSLFARPDQHSASRLVTRSLAITGDPDLSASLDGAINIHLPISIRIRPNAIRAIVPRKPAEGTKSG